MRRNGTRIGIGVFAVAAALACAAGRLACAAEPTAATCAVPSDIQFNDIALPRVAAKLKAGEPVRIVVLGTGSSSGMGVSKAEYAYPERLSRELARRFPKERFTIANLSKHGQFASEMERRLASDVVGEPPSLVIWQTGTVDAVRGVDVASFGQTLSDGIDLLAQHGIDVILMNMQYSPHTSTALDVGAYRDYMHWVATNRSITLFDRYAIMKYWAENGAIDFSDPSKAEQTRADDFVNGCIALLLADAIEAGVEAAEETKPE